MSKSLYRLLRDQNHFHGVSCMKMLGQITCTTVESVNAFPHRRSKLRERARDT